jgi:hypothetical protein
MSDTDDTLGTVTDNLRELDPSFLEGFDVIFNNEVPISFRTGDVDSDARPVRVRVLERKGGSPTSGEIRIELLEDDRISLIRVCSIPAPSYKDLATANGLKIDFPDLAKSLTDLLISSVERPPQSPDKRKLDAPSHSLRFVEGDADGGQLLFLQKLRLRSVTILKLDFAQAPADFVQRQVQYRFNALKVELQRKTNEYDSQMWKLRQTNPSLERQLQSTIDGTVQTKIKSLK